MDQNSIETQVFLMLFFGIFQLLGAIFLGLGVRQMIAGESNGVGQVFIGTIFGGVGLLFSALFMYQMNTWGFPAGAMITFGVALTTMFAPQELLTRFGASILMIGIGGIVALMGALVLIAAWRTRQEILFGILFGGCWGSVGLMFLLTGLGALVRGKPLRFKQTGSGSYTIEQDKDSATKPSRRQKD